LLSRGRGPRGPLTLEERSRVPCFVADLGSSRAGCWKDSQSKPRTGKTPVQAGKTPVQESLPRVAPRESLLQESPQESLGVASGSRSWKTSVDRELEPHDPSREGGCVSPIVGRRLPLLDRRHPGPRSSPPITHVHARRAVVILDRDACPRSPHRPRMDVPECPRRDADPQRSREACLSTIAPHRPPSPHRPRPD